MSLFPFPRFLLATVLTFPMATAAAERVGLVLAGGGARGLAHVGVIRALEELQVPVHAVTGTSMGALVGGLYSAGMDAAALDAAVADMDWSQAFRDTEQRALRPQRRKGDDYDAPGELRLQLSKSGPADPLGVLEGQQARAMIVSMLQGAEYVSDFDQLPRPYRAVATDIATGMPVVLAQGDMGSVMRASMSIPGLLAPVEMDGRLLVDGGASMNIPVQPALDMGVDHLIVVDIGTHLKPQDEIGGMVAVAAQLVKLMSLRNSNEQLALMRPEDVLIAPDVASIGLLDFYEAEQIVALGYEATMAMAAQLQALRLSDAAWQDYVAATQPLPQARQQVDFIALDNDSNISDQVLLAKIEQQKGQPLDSATLERNIADAYALGYWKTIEYSLVTDERGEGVQITARASEREASSLKFSLGLLSEIGDQTDFGLFGSYLARDLNSRGGELYGSLELGDRPAAYLQFYQPLDYGSRFFIAPAISYSDKKVTSLGIEFDLGESVGDWRVETTQAELMAGFQFGDSAQFQVGPFRASGHYDFSRTATADLEEGSFDEGGWLARFRYDTLDDLYFPTRGNFLYADYQYHDSALGADAELKRARLIGQSAISLGADDQHTLIFSGRVFASEDAPAQPQNLYQLGGLFNFSGLPYNALSGRQLAFVMAQYQRRLTQPGVLPFVSPIYVGASIEGAELWSFREDISLGELNWAGSLYVGTDTPVGPVYFAWGVTSDSADTFYLALSWPFMLDDLRPGR
ncbi:patatin-like phospholipase family protein [Pseudohalioglobus sediminis]|nr:patatin-like phospholipase family protein [Pseudohalioglobus sediminis]